MVAHAVGLQRKDGKDVPEPLSTRKFSGRLLPRTPPELHHALATEAAQQDMPLNQLIVARLAHP